MTSETSNIGQMIKVTDQPKLDPYSTWGHPNIPMHHWSERPIVRKTNSPTDH